jgi:hypothetical protein
MCEPLKVHHHDLLRLQGCRRSHFQAGAGGGGVVGLTSSMSRMVPCLVKRALRLDLETKPTRPRSWSAQSGENGGRNRARLPLACHDGRFGVVER